MKLVLLMLTILVLGFPILAFGAEDAAKPSVESGMKYKDCMTKYSDEEMCSEVAILGGERAIASDPGETITEVAVKAAAAEKE